MTAGSVRGYSSCPAASQCRCQPAAPTRVGRAVAGAVARGVVPVQDGDRGDEQARAHPVEDGAGHAQVGPVGRVVARRTRRACRAPPSTPRRPARRAAPRPRSGWRPRWGGCAAGRCRRGPSCPRRRPRTRRSARRSTRRGCGPRRRPPPAARSPSPPPAGRGRCAASRRGTPPSARAPRASSAGTSCDAAQRPHARADHVRVADDHAGDRRRARRSAAPRPRPPRP